MDEKGGVPFVSFVSFVSREASPLFSLSRRRNGVGGVRRQDFKIGAVSYDS